jgi:hypothetical protein
LALLLNPGLLNDTLARLKLFSRQVQIRLERWPSGPGLRRTRLRHGALFGLNRCWRRRCALDPPTLGFNHDGLGPAVTKALLNGSGAHSPNAGL